MDGRGAGTGWEWTGRESEMGRRAKACEVMGV